MPNINQHRSKYIKCHFSPMVICTDKCLLCNSWISTKKMQIWNIRHALLLACTGECTVMVCWENVFLTVWYALPGSKKVQITLMQRSHLLYYCYFLAWAGNKTGLSNPDKISIVLSLLPSQYFVDLLLNCWNNMEANSSLLLFIRWLACQKYIYEKLYVNKILQIVAWALGIDRTRRITN